MIVFFMAGNFAFSQEKNDNGDEKEGYKFTEEIRLDCSPVKNQYRSGTCWGYSGLGFLESELINNGKGGTTFQKLSLFGMLTRTKPKSTCVFMET